MIDGFNRPEEFLGLPTLVVFGAGNTAYGPQPGTLVNANAAVGFLDSGMADFNLVFALGRGPNPKINYPRTEAEIIANAISLRFGAAAPAVQCDTRSVETADNVVELARMLEAFTSVSHLGFVAASAHAERALVIAHKVLGKRRYEIQLMPSTFSSVFGTAKERALSGLYRAVTAGAEPENLAMLERRHKAYRLAVMGPKRIVRAIPRASSRY